MTDQATSPDLTSDLPDPAAGLPEPTAGLPEPTADLWTSIDELCAWLDANRPAGGEQGVLSRMLKLSEEVGEVAQAVIGATGQNPRKGVTHRCYLGSPLHSGWSEPITALRYVRHVYSWGS
jgi:hypothetical protein